MWLLFHRYFHHWCFILCIIAIKELLSQKGKFSVQYIQKSLSESRDCAIMNILAWNPYLKALKGTIWPMVIDHQCIKLLVVYQTEKYFWRASRKFWSRCCIKSYYTTLTLQIRPPCFQQYNISFPFLFNNIFSGSHWKIFHE